MTQRGLNTVAGVVFGVIAAVHAMRILFGWEAIIGGWTVPQAVSWVALFVFGALALSAFRLKG